MKKIICSALAILFACLFVSSMSLAEKVIKIRLGHVAPLLPYSITMPIFSKNT